MDHTSYAALSSFIHPHTLCIHVWLSDRSPRERGTVTPQYVLTQTSFTPDSDFFHHTFCTVHTVHSVCSHLIIIFTLCWCFALVANPLLTTIAHHIFSSVLAEPQPPTLTAHTLTMINCCSCSLCLSAMLSISFKRHRLQYPASCHMKHVCSKATAAFSGCSQSRGGPPTLRTKSAFVLHVLNDITYRQAEHSERIDPGQFNACHRSFHGLSSLPLSQWICVLEYLQLVYLWAHMSTRDPDDPLLSHRSRTGRLSCLVYTQVC